MKCRKNTSRNKSKFMKKVILQKDLTFMYYSELDCKLSERVYLAIITKTIQVRSKGENDIIDITAPILKAILESKLKDGIVTVFVSGSTAAVTTIEYEPGLRSDFPM